jgi:CheY-like chemotaxis protein
MGKQRIYIADDDSSVRNVTRMFLKTFLPENKYEFEFFEDGIGLLRRLEEQEKPSLVITDHEMPGITGGEIIEVYAKKIPFVLIFGGDKEIGEKAMEHRAKGYLIKPYKIQDLRSLVGKILNLK